jgi:hypothetical protein
VTSTLSQRAYARHRGVTPRAVKKAIDSGRITLTRNKRIDPVKADKQWDDNTSPDLRSGGADPFSNKAVYAKARAHRETYTAKLAKLEFEERSGRLIDRSEVERVWFESGQLIRDGILNVPARLGSLLASISDPHQVHQLLDAELRKALNEVSDTVTVH